MMFRDKNNNLQSLRKSTLVLIIRDRVSNTGITLGDKIQVHSLAKIAIFCFFLTYGFQTLDFLKARDDADSLLECFSVMSFSSMGILKLFSLIKNRKRWNYLLSTATKVEEDQLTIKTNYDESENTDDSTEFLENIEIYTKIFQTTSIVLTRLYYVTAVVYILTPFIEYTLRQLNGAEISGWPHILLIWSPSDSISFAAYLTTIIIETIASVYCVLVHLAFDLTTVGLIVFVWGQFRLIQDYSEKIGDEKATYRISKQTNERAHLRILRCHKIHVMLTSSIGELRKVLTDILGVYFFIAALTLCSVSVRLNSEISAIQLASLIQYMCATLTQLFLFCYYGDNLLNKSSVGMGQGPFGAAYWSLSPRLRKELVILGMGMSRPCRLYAGPFISIDLQSFIQIIRTAYSYYAVIRKNE